MSSTTVTAVMCWWCGIEGLGIVACNLLHCSILDEELEGLGVDWCQCVEILVHDVWTGLNGPGILVGKRLILLRFIEKDQQNVNGSGMTL